jgi:hypothetical protein
MTDWRTIVEKSYDDAYSYHVFHDPDYADEYTAEEHRAFEIWATAGTQRYLPVDRVIDPANQEEVESMLAEATAYMPLYLFAHSGVSVSTVPFGDPYDSGQCGFAVITNPDKHGISVDAMGHDWNATISGLVKEYDNVLRGNVISWTITKNIACDSCKHVKSEVIDGIAGYVGYDFSEIDNLIEQEIIPTIQEHVRRDQEAENGPSSVNIGQD